MQYINNSLKMDKIKWENKYFENNNTNLLMWIPIVRNLDDMYLIVKAGKINKKQNKKQMLIKKYEMKENNIEIKKILIEITKNKICSSLANIIISYMGSIECLIFICQELGYYDKKMKIKYEPFFIVEIRSHLLNQFLSFEVNISCFDIDLEVINNYVNNDLPPKLITKNNIYCREIHCLEKLFKLMQSKKRRSIKNKLYIQTIYYKSVAVRICLMKCSNYQNNNMWNICSYEYDKTIKKETHQCIGIPIHINHLVEDINEINNLSQINNKYVFIIKVEDDDSKFNSFSHDELNEFLNSFNICNQNFFDKYLTEYIYFNEKIDKNRTKK